MHAEFIKQSFSILNLCDLEMIKLYTLIDHDDLNNTGLLSGSAIKNSLILQQQQMNIWKINFHINQGCASLRSQRAHKSSLLMGECGYALVRHYLHNLLTNLQPLHTKPLHSLTDLCSLTLFQAFHAFHYGYNISRLSGPVQCWTVIVSPLKLLATKFLSLIVKCQIL